jgi:hypothetical protein
MVQQNDEAGDELMRSFTYYSPGHFEIQEDSHRLWMATSRLDDHFHHLGGSARYPHWADSDGPLYICVALASRLHEGFDHRMFLNADFFNSANTVLTGVNSDLDAISTGPDQLVELIEEYIGVVESRIPARHRSAGWERFVSQFHMANRSSDPTAMA